MASVIIRKATDSDTDFIKEIEDRVQPFPWSRHGFVQEISKGSGNSWFWCLCPSDNLSIVHGYICFRIVGKECCLLNIALKPEWQGQGFGTLLVEYLVRFMRRRRVRRLVLDVYRENRGAIRFYESVGLRLVASPEKIRGKFCVMEMKLPRE